MRSAAYDLSEILSPNIRVAMYHQTHHPYRLKPRVIFDYELLYMAEGSLIVTIDKCTYTVRPGDIILIKPGVEHSFASASTGLLIMPHIHFDLLYYDDFDKLYTSFKSLSGFTSEDKKLIRPDLLSNEQVNIPEYIQVYNHMDIQKTLLKIIDVHNGKGLMYKVKEKELFLKLFHDLILAIKIQSDVSIKNNVKKLDEIREYIIKNLDKNITLEELSKMSCLSIFHLGRLFKKYYGMPIMTYQRERRMDAAKTMMLYSKMSLSSIAEKIGYSSIHAFSKAFKKECGMSPSEYIQNAHMSMQVKKPNYLKNRITEEQKG